MNKSNNFYIRLFHGRGTPEETLDNWGFEGPLIGPVGISWTYGSIKVHDPGWDDFCFLPVHEDLVRYQGKFYGDFDIFSADDSGISDKDLEAAHDFETFSASAEPTRKETK